MEMQMGKISSSGKWKGYFFSKKRGRKETKGGPPLLGPDPLSRPKEDFPVSFPSFCVFFSDFTYPPPPITPAPSPSSWFWSKGKVCKNKGKEGKGYPFFALVGKNEEQKRRRGCDCVLFGFRKKAKAKAKQHQTRVGNADRIELMTFFGFFVKTTNLFFSRSLPLSTR